MAIIPNSSTDHNSNRTLCGMTYEKNRTQILMTGGKDINKSSILSTAAGLDTWAFANGGSWALSAPTASPFHRYAHAMTFSNDDGYSFIHGGLDSIGVQFSGDLWFYNGTTWAQFATAFTPGSNAPQVRYAHTMVSADGYNNLFLFGGIGTTLIDRLFWLNDTWTFSTTTKSWTQLTSTNNPPVRGYHGMGFDGYNMWVFGGESNGTFLNDVWKMNALGKQWSQVSTTGTAPISRKGAAVCWDGFNNRLMVVGGYTNNYGLSNETWTLSTAGAWTLQSTPFHPIRKWGASMVFNSGNNTIVLFGGTLADGSPDGSVFTYTCATGIWTGAGDFSAGAANGPVSSY